MLKEEDHKSNKVQCLMCKKKGKSTIFCWVCLKPWKTPKDVLCGNIDCGIMSVNQLLKEAPTTTIWSTANVPLYRACLKCQTPIEHKAACKHMTCTSPQCQATGKCEFCFICLIPWVPKHLSEICKVAPRQEF
jgi:hypothetical protein